MSGYDAICSANDSTFIYKNDLPQKGKIVVKAINIFRLNGLHGLLFLHCLDGIFHQAANSHGAYAFGYRCNIAT
jgi:hypothetical protein